MVRALVLGDKSHGPEMKSTGEAIYFINELKEAYVETSSSLQGVILPSQRTPAHDLKQLPGTRGQQEPVVVQPEEVLSGRRS